MAELEQVVTQVVDGWIERLAHGPLLINLDGCRLTDPVACHVVAQLLRAMASDQTPGCALLWTGELPESQRTESRWTRLELPPLDVRQVAFAVRSMLYALDPLPWEDQVHAVTGGDPRLIVEMVRVRGRRGFRRSCWPPRTEPGSRSGVWMRSAPRSGSSWPPSLTRPGQFLIAF